MIKPQIIWTQDKIDYLIENYPNGSTSEMMEYLKIKYTTLKCAAQRFNVKRNDDLKYLNKVKPLLSNTYQNWYWLGLLMADGWLGDNGDLKISLSEIDVEHLKKLGKYLDVNVTKTNGLTYNNKTSKDFYTIAVRDVINTKILKDRFKITTKKSINACSLKCLNSESKLISFFIGFIDGDGCITQNKITKNANMIRIQCHSSWFDNFEFLSDEIYKYLGIKFRVYIDTQGFVKMVLTKNKEMKILKETILKYNLTVLNRKWDKI